MKTALVTGSAGFVGRHLVPKLRARGYAVLGVDLANGGLEAFTGQAADFDVVVHLAANILDVDQRTKGGVGMYADIALDLLMCAWLERNPPREAFIAMSSCAVDYPDDPYSWVKRTLEQLCGRLHKQGVPVVILRPFSGYSADQAQSYPFPAILGRAMRHEDPLTVWGGPQVRDWLHIDDLTDAIVYAIHGFPKGEPIEIGTGIGTDFFTLARKMAEAAGYKPAIVGDTSKASSSPKRVADEKKAADYGWFSKITLAEGIKRSVESLQVLQR